ncbi:YibE/F family protein [Desulforegula conservatrix]|uniref:YibE/F family protein n=1 Tax=Desulforegula conservatrix TaxID=153026 RepID=UPI000417B1FB|nr:YibE/F family protein [Desulforegula conservatrix]
MKHLFKIDNNVLFIIVLLIFIAVMLVMPTGFEKVVSSDSIRAKALVTGTDNSLLNQHGIVKTGAQRLKLEVLDSEFKGRIIETHNHLIGKMEMDKVFNLGDKALVVLNLKNGDIANTTVIDHYRTNIEIYLFALFFIMVTVVAGKTGLKAMLSFIFTVLYLWKILLPAFLRGWNPILVSLASIMILTGVIIFSIAGISNKGFSAFLGSMSGIVMTCALSLTFGKYFKIHGAVLPFSEPLLYTGFPFLNLTGIFYSGIFIASSGVIMDVAMDIAAAMHEIKEKSPDISTGELVKSGLEVGRAVLGTMTTTLLLAYFGGYASMFMLFIAMGTPVMNIVNIQYVSAEIMHTLVGSFGLVTVVPFTAFMGGLIFSHRENETVSANNEELQMAEAEV